MQITRFFPLFMLRGHLHDICIQMSRTVLLGSDDTWYRALDKLAKLCDEELDGQHPNIGHGSGRDIDPLHRQGVIAL